MQNASIGAPVTGRRITPNHINYAKIARRKDLGGVSRWQLIQLAERICVTGVVTSRRSRDLLTVLVKSCPKESFEPGGLPVVYRSNQDIAHEMGITEGRVSRLLTVLHNAGLVCMIDSGNYKRYAVYGRDGNIINACGIDLRILAARYEEIKKILDEKDAEYRHKKALRGDYSGKLRQIKNCLATAELTEQSESIRRRTTHIMNIVGKASRAASLRLEKAISLLRRMLERIYGIRTVKTTYRRAENDTHIESTNSNPVCNSNAAQNNMCPIDIGQNILLDAGSARKKKAPERKSGVKNGYLSQSRDVKITRINKAILDTALPNAMSYAQSLGQGGNLARTTDFMSKILGISVHALDCARKIMGHEKTALSVAIILEKWYAGLINSPGGYLRAMTNRDRTGDLHLIKSVYAMKEAKLRINRSEKT